MSAPLLTIDLGNSTLDAMLHDGSTQPPRARLQPADLDSFARFVESGAARMAVGLATVPRGLEPIRAWLSSRGVELLEAGRELACPMPTRYAHPETLGVDRWVGALCAHRRHGAVLTIDCGTAATVNAVSAEGTFLGGAIAPGAQALAHGLAAKAPALPRADVFRTGDPALPATVSQDAVDAGVRWGFAGLVERLADEVAAAAGLEAAPRVVSGGAAALFLRHARGRYEHVPDLVHRGLALLWDLRATRC